MISGRPEEGNLIGDKLVSIPAQEPVGCDALTPSVSGRIL